MNRALSDVRLEEIEHAIQLGIEAAMGLRNSYEGVLMRLYFAGRTLCIDFSDIDSPITISHSDEDFGFFSGGPRRLLSIKGLKRLEELMFLCNVKFESKWLIKN